MRKVLMILITSFMSLGMIGCTNEQLEDAIDQCKGDPECYIIVDELIEEEMNARGIQGGKMTSTEMENVLSLINNYTEYLTGFGEIPYMDDYAYVIEVLNSYTGWLNAKGFLSEERTADFDKAYNNITSGWYIKYLATFTDLNEENKQLFYDGEDKYVIYKTGLNEFTLEVSNDIVYEFRIDIGRDLIYFNDQKVQKSVDISELLSGDLNETDVKLFVEEDLISFCVLGISEYQLLECEGVFYSNVNIPFSIEIEPKTININENIIEGYQFSVGTLEEMNQIKPIRVFFENYNGSFQDLLSTFENINEEYLLDSEIENDDISAVINTLDFITELNLEFK